MAAPEIFDPALRRRRRDRAQPDYAAHSFLRDTMIEGLLERLDFVTRDLGEALDLGCADGSLTRALRSRGLMVTPCDAGARFAEAVGGVQSDEDALPFAPGSFDLIVSAGVLDTVNDLPGALIQCRRALRPDGLLLAAFVGAGSLPALKAAITTADAGQAAPARFHPQIDVRAAGDLLLRSGFTLPVADVEPLDVRYGSLFTLISDLRGMAATNQLAGQTPPWIGRTRLQRAAQAFADAAEPDGRTHERFQLIFVTAWSPAPISHSRRNADRRRRVWRRR